MFKIIFKFTDHNFCFVHYQSMTDPSTLRLLPVSQTSVNTAKKVLPKLSIWQVSLVLDIWTIDKVSTCPPTALSLNNTWPGPCTVPGREGLLSCTGKPGRKETDLNKFYSQYRKYMNIHIWSAWSKLNGQLNSYYGRPQLSIKHQGIKITIMY